LFRDEEVGQIAHRPLGIRDSGPDGLNAALGFLDWPQQRLAFFPHNAQELTGDAAQAAIPRVGGQAAARVLGQIFQAGNQPRPIPFSPTTLQLIESTSRSRVSRTKP
jgi:hypothetical protein